MISSSSTSDATLSVFHCFLAVSDFPRRQKWKWWLRRLCLKFKFLTYTLISPPTPPLPGSLTSKGENYHFYTVQNLQFAPLPADLPSPSTNLVHLVETIQSRSYSENSDFFFFSISLTVFWRDRKGYIPKVHQIWSLVYFPSVTQTQLGIALSPPQHWLLFYIPIWPKSSYLKHHVWNGERYWGKRKKDSEGEKQQLYGVFLQATSTWSYRTFPSQKQDEISQLLVFSFNDPNLSNIANTLMGI